MKYEKIAAVFMAVVLIFSAFGAYASAADTDEAVSEAEVFSASAEASTELVFSGVAFNVIVSIEAYDANGYGIEIDYENCRMAADPVELSAEKADMFYVTLDKSVAAGYEEDGVTLSGEAVKYTFVTDSSFVGDVSISLDINVIDDERRTIVENSVDIVLPVVTPVITVYTDISDSTVMYPYTDGGYVEFIINTPITLSGFVLENFVCDNPAITLDYENAEYIGAGDCVMSDGSEEDGIVFALAEMTEISGSVVRIPFTVDVGSEFGSFGISCSGRYDREIGIICDFNNAYGTITTVKLSDGDINGDGIANSSDAVYLLWNQFYPDEYPIDSFRECDFDGNGIVNISDSVCLLWRVIG